MIWFFGTFIYGYSIFLILQELTIYFGRVRLVDKHVQLNSTLLLRVSLPLAECLDEQLKNIFPSFQLNDFAPDYIKKIMQEAGVVHLPFSLLVYQSILLSLPFSFLFILTWSKILLLMVLTAGLLPWLWLRSIRNSRQASIRKEAVPLLMQLRLGIMAGLDLNQSIIRIINLNRSSLDKKNNEIGKLLPLLQNDLSAGYVVAGWNNFDERASSEIISDIVRTITQSVELGSPIYENLTSLQLRMRNQSLNKAERAGALATQKLLLPLVTCMLPAYFMLTFGGLIARFYYGELGAIFP